MQTEHACYQLIKQFPHSPGIYQMFDELGKIIYVGKAKDLNKRIKSYFQDQQNSPKTELLMQKVVDITFIVTNSEAEALILENNLIKQHRPKYNIWFRDDKSYPYIRLTEDKDFPRLEYFRKHRKMTRGKLFGPFPSGHAVRETLDLLQKLFRIRSCQDNFFRHRQRPCLQYQIERCSAPCVGYISPEQYAKDIQHAQLFLQGKNQKIIDELIVKMNQAAEQFDYEQAAFMRDQIARLRAIQSEQVVEKQQGDCDVVAIASYQQHIAIEVLTIRFGKVQGNRTFYPKTHLKNSLNDTLQAFLQQHYLSLPKSMLPPLIIVDGNIAHQDSLHQALMEYAGYKIKIVTNVRGQNADWLQLAKQNVNSHLQNHLQRYDHTQQRIQALAQVLDVNTPIRRIECFDISHSQGESPVASCVVFTEKGADKKHYRSFNIRNITKNDDYAAIYQGVFRRFKQLQKEEKPFPDVLLIDGGIGQSHQAQQALFDLAIEQVLIIGIAKGITRKPGLETLHIVPGDHEIHLDPHHPGLHLLQQVRDEAHRFAITRHRQQRDKKRQTSPLERITGIGPQKRKKLLQHFGGIQALQAASQEDIAKVSGIGTKLAQLIYQQLHT